MYEVRLQNKALASVKPDGACSGIAEGIKQIALDGAGTSRGGVPQ